MKRVAFFTPLNPLRSGISDYSEALLPHLAARAEQVDVFIEDYQPEHLWPQERLRIHPYREFESEHRAQPYDAVLYQMGNNPHHVYIYDLALRIPGVLVLHEYNLHYLLADVTVARQDWEGYLREVEYDSGPAAVERARRAQQGREQLDYDGVALNRRLLERSRGAIVHSDYMVRRIAEGGFGLLVRKIPHGVEIPSVDRTQARRRLAERSGLALDDATPVFGIFGFLKPYKRIHEVLQALSRLRTEYPNAKMVLVGEEHPHYPLRPQIAELGLEDAVRILGFVPLAEFSSYMAACDVCLNLRRPTAGETSGSFLRALALGKPTLVSEIGSFLELPEDIAVKIPVDDREVDWLQEYMRVLLADRELASAIGERGRSYVAAECAWPKVADEYMQFLEEIGSQAQNGGNARRPEVVRADGAVGTLRIPREELQDYVMGFSHATKLMEDYVSVHLERLVHTLLLTPAGTPQDRVLEMGCYLQMTPALRKYLGYGEVRGAYYGAAGQTKHPTTTSISGEVFTCPVDLFDAERDRFPYPEEHFQTVLCCELIEHLSADPMHMMAEIHRTLVPGGTLIMTTPNIASLRGVHALLHGYHPELLSSYIRPNPDGVVDPRHSREYTPREIALLMETAGFRVDLLETGDYGKPQPYAEWTEKLLQTHDCPAELRGEIIYCRARKAGPVRDRWPKEFYYPP